MCTHVFAVCHAQAVAPDSRAPNAVDVLKTVGVYTLDPEQADTVLSLRL